MAIKPIIFSDPVVGALLDGRKTQTRRILKPQPFEEEGQWWIRPKNKAWSPWSVCELNRAALKSCHLPYAPGDLLWAREAWAHNPDVPAAVPTAVCYRADPGHEYDGLRWHPSIHMPRWASRLTLEVTAVRVERLQDISEDDARAEGIVPQTASNGHVTYHVPGLVRGQTAARAFRLLWDSIYGSASWDANPWVTATSFIVHRGNVDDVARRLGREVAHG